jgi:hypothetical protein
MTNTGLPIQAKVLLLSLGVLLFGSIALTLWHMASFHVVSSSLTAKNISTISPYFTVSFNENLSAGSARVTSSPNVTGNNTTINGKNLTIPFTTTLNANTYYAITITRITSTSGKVLTNQTFTFKPTYIASQNLPGNQQKKLVGQQSDGKINANDPIVPHLPYQTTDFSLAEDTNPQNNPSGTFPLIATLTLSQADMGDETTAVAQYKQEVVSYIQSLGLNPSNYTITYVTQTP